MAYHIFFTKKYLHYCLEENMWVKNLIPIALFKQQTCKETVTSSNEGRTVSSRLTWNEIDPDSPANNATFSSVQWSNILETKQIFIFIATSKQKLKVSRIFYFQDKLNTASSSPTFSYFELSDKPCLNEMLYFSGQWPENECKLVVVMRLHVGKLRYEYL